MGSVPIKMCWQSSSRFFSFVKSSDLVVAHVRIIKDFEKVKVEHRQFRVDHEQNFLPGLSQRSMFPQVLCVPGIRWHGHSHELEELSYSLRGKRRSGSTSRGFEALAQTTRYQDPNSATWSRARRRSSVRVCQLDQVLCPQQRHFQLLLLHYCRPLLKDIKQLGENRIILDCKNDHVQEILKQAQQVGIMTAYHTFFITTLVRFGSDWALIVVNSLCTIRRTNVKLLVTFLATFSLIRSNNDHKSYFWVKKCKLQSMENVISRLRVQTVSLLSL